VDAGLRGGRMPVVGRIADAHLLLDLRSVPERDDELLVSAIGEAFMRGGGA